MKNINVLYVDNGFSGNSGASLSLINLIEAIRSNINPLAVFLSDKILDSELLANINCPYICYNTGCIRHSVTYKPFKKLLSYPFKSFKYFFNSINAIKKLCNIIKENKIEIVHSNKSIFFVGLIAAKICGVKHVWHLRDFETKFNQYPYIGFIGLRYLLSLSDSVISITNSINEFYKSKNSKIIYDAVFKSSQTFEVCDVKDNYLFFCGNLIPSKGVISVVKAFIAISEKYPELSLKIAGIGPLNDEITKIAKENNLEKRIELLGYVKNPMPLYEKAKAFIMASDFEALGRVTIEAMFANCLVIGKNSGATSELIKNGETGLLYNTNEELTECINKVMNDKDNFKNIRSNAKKFAEQNFFESIFAPKMLKVYEELIKPNKNSF